MKAFLIALLFEAVTTGAFFKRISSDTNDGDIGLGVLFWTMLFVYALVDGAWLGILLWRMR